MSVSPVERICRQVFRGDDEPLNILCAPAHARYESQLCHTGHNFYSYQHEMFKQWEDTNANVPENYYVLDKSLGSKQIPIDVEFDAVLSHNKFGQFQILSQIANQLKLPLISLEHTLPVPGWSEERLESLRNMQGHFNIFLSSYSRDAWEWWGKSHIIGPAIDHNVFKPASKPRNNTILSVVNDWINRDWCCGYRKWLRVTNGLPVTVVGDTPGLSEPASSLDELVNIYQTNRIFLNTSTISTCPFTLLEAMACGCAVVSTATSMIPQVIENGVNGFITNDEQEMSDMLVELLHNPNLAHEMGMKARKTIVDRFNVQKFVQSWNIIFKAASYIIV